jgi:hypothetical protein
VAEQAQQRALVQVGLHPRRVVVDADRQIDCIGHFGEERSMSASVAQI